MIPVGCSREIMKATQLLFQSRRFYGIGTAPYVHRCLLSGVKLALGKVYFGLRSCSRPMPAVRCLCTSGHTIHSWSVAVLLVTLHLFCN